MAFANETFTLPSNGKLQGDIPKDVVLRNMTTSDEKILLGSSVDQIDRIIKSCVVEPKTFDYGNLTSADKHFLLVKLRVLSYGETYVFTYRCPSCSKKVKAEVNLDELPVKYLPEDFKEPYDTFELPVSGKTVSLKLPRLSDIERNSARVKKFEKQFPDSIVDVSYIYGLMSQIESVDGEVLRFSDLQKFLEELPVKDTSFIKHRISKLEIGLDTNIVRECPKCKDDIEFTLPVGPEFFRSYFGD